MKTVQISLTLNNEIEAIRAAGKTPWVVIRYEEVCGVYRNRDEARGATRVIQDSKPAKADEVKLEVVEQVTETPITLGLPLTDSTEAVNQPAKAEEYKPYAYEHHGFINCPHCGIGLDNGIGDHMMEVNGKMKKCTKTKEYWCMACDGEFGPDLAPVADKPEATAPKRKVEVTHLSTVERPCKKVWAIADEMHAANPNCKRREVLAECVKQGIAFYTARTQYQQWLGIQKEMAERAAMQAAAKK